MSGVLDSFRLLGLVYKKGKFSAVEEQQLKQAIDNYIMVNPRPFFLFIVTYSGDIADFERPSN